MSRLIGVLQEIRDQQKVQLENFQRSLAVQDEAMQLQRRGRKILLFLIFMPWLTLVGVLLILLFNPKIFF